MKLSRILIIAAALFFSAPQLMAQPAESQVLDGIYERQNTKERQILPYDHIREADAFWEKRVWRVIDIREKINLPFMFPKEPFISILLDLAQSGEVTVYSGVDDEFTEPVGSEDLGQLLNSVDTVYTVDPETYEEIETVVQNDFNPETITSFRVKESWVFDEERSMMVCRIIGIAPVEDVYDENGNYRGQRLMFWAYYPELRPLLVNYETFNPFNDAIRLSWEDLLEMRMFNSYVMKESNVYDRRIQDYASGVDALYESERVKNEIFKFEHDLWTY